MIIPARRSHRRGLTSSLIALCALLFLSACPEGDENPDAGDVEEVPIEVELGMRFAPDYEFIELPPDPTFEIVSGFQGGYHIEPALRIAQPEASEFISVVDYTVTDVDTGEIFTDDPYQYRVSQREWDFEPGLGYVRTWEQIILDFIDDDDAAGRSVRIDVRVHVEETNAVGTDSAVVEIVNETNELQ
jgi:hypothetical protein